MQVPHDEVTQVVAPLVGVAQVRGELGVERDAREVVAARRELVPGRLRAVHDLGPLRVGEPRGERLVVGARDVGELERDGRPGVVGHREAPRVPAARHGLAGHLDAQRARAVLGQPGAQAPRQDVGERDVEPRLGLDLALGGDREEPVAQGAELQGVEHAVGGLAVPGTGREVVGADRQLEVAQERVELPVEADLVEVRPQVSPLSRSCP